MKQLTCEMCGGTDLIKQDGVFVCQSCGCKYSIEEAKKMMVEGTVDVSGSEVKIDRSTELDNLRTLAYRAKEAGDSESAAKYFEQILVANPDDWEATFYATLYAASNCKIAQIGQAALRVGNILDSVFELICKEYDGAIEKAQETDVGGTEKLKIEVKKGIARKKIVDDALGFFNMLTNNALSNVGRNAESLRENVNRWFVPIYQAMIMMGDGVLKWFDDAASANTIYDAVFLASESAATWTAQAKQIRQIACDKMKRTTQYWIAHKDELDALEAELQSLSEEKSVLIEKIGSLDLLTGEIKGREFLINDLKAEKDAIVFSRGKKQAIQDEIDALNKEAAELKSSLAEQRNAIGFEACEQRCEEIDQRMKEIRAELDKDR